jgi:hypothetical protein
MKTLNIPGLLKNLEGVKCTNCHHLLNETEKNFIVSDAIKYNETDPANWCNLCNYCESEKQNAARYDADYNY